MSDIKMDQKDGITWVDIGDGYLYGLKGPGEKKFLQHILKSKNIQPELAKLWCSTRKLKESAEEPSTPPPQEEAPAEDPETPDEPETPSEEPTEPPKDETPAELDLSKMNKAQLIALAKEKGIRVAKTWKEETIRAKLQNA